MYLERLFDITFSVTFNKLSGAKLQKEGRRYNEQERFFNPRFSNYYLPFTITFIRSFNIKEIHLTQQWFRWNPFIWLHSTCNYWMFRFYFMKVSLTYSQYHKNDFLTSRYLWLLEKFEFPINLVHVVGLEPTRICIRQILSLVRLPFRHTCKLN